MREWRFYVEDMVAFCDKVMAYTQGLDRSSFAVDAMRYDATLRNLELIGEAAMHVPDDVRSAIALLLRSVLRGHPIVSGVGIQPCIARRAFHVKGSGYT